MGIKIIVTLQYAIEKCDVIDFCAATGIDFYKLDQIPEDKEFTLSAEDAEFLGLIILN